MLRKFPASHFIKMAMEIKDMSAEELARQSNVPAAEISMILNNKTPFTIKNDVKIGPVLDYPIGFLSRLESVYQEWRLYQLENWKEIKVEDYCFCYRKHKNVNEEKFKKTIISAARKIKEEENAIKLQKDFNSIFYNDYLALIDDICDAHDFKEAVLKLNSWGINIYLFDGVNIRGFSKMFQNKMFVFINEKLNLTIDSFIMTLTHELIHHLNLSDQKIKFNLVDDKKQEEEIDNIAINYMLKEHKETINDALSNNDLKDVSIKTIKTWAEALSINWIFLFGYICYYFKNYSLRNTSKEILINYKDQLWLDKNI